MNNEVMYKELHPLLLILHFVQIQSIAIMSQNLNSLKRKVNMMGEFGRII